jgi:hypothetical protein
LVDSTLFFVQAGAMLGVALLLELIHCLAWCL